MFEFLKRYMPRSLYGRAALILLLPILTLQVTISLVFIQRHFEQVTTQMTEFLIVDLAHLVSYYDDGDPLALAQAANVARALRFEIEDPALAQQMQEDRVAFEDLSGRALIRTLHDSPLPITHIDLTHPRRVFVALDTNSGPYVVSFERRRIAASNPHQLLVLIIVLSVLLTFISYVFLRNQLRPIKRLSEASLEYGKGRVIPYRPSGSTEVRAAGAAFVEMRNRIERQVQQRTQMLSGVSHDLRTPLTRLKLGLSISDDPEAVEMLKDVEEMEHMLDAFLDFSRSDAEAALEYADPVALVRDTVAKAQKLGQVVLTQTAGVGMVQLRPDSIRRALENLIGNAQRYADQVQVSVLLNERNLRIIVEDNGPGIPASLREDAMRPFVRLDPARNQDQGSGVGLGLAIVADVARSHGGQLRLSQSETLGGLRAELVLAR
ncbi:ATP-binding protein [Ketogulonicigenium vulgare]|uniref:histidine kinase n=1 Tax=Ketogulonicigenium vulgare (strain WSH-001) TaxID=759362 RepID=F9Y5X7_KETVW|nr:ATP-binding protein [Ketogulonicigenium vulgare]ADO42611.1 integral membrane sensor signal transduction histidine kinase [Ketogulonicigenium vulgare Y25]AEM40802.1 Sensor protein [Ketogulonicigenium vulgare WSH-001]ALJ80967.1 histidine kinase [Ketogulonicigenium vulgare]ANW33732.1 two-component sensor histidine kinase [Ketogulonicigenium vulgare]AOZ54520.1 integral membrane sensor signal transduction histidine kinase [Ketogulonicigenium vulgare]